MIKIPKNNSKLEHSEIIQLLEEIFEDPKELLLVVMEMKKMEEGVFQDFLQLYKQLTREEQVYFLLKKLDKMANNKMIIKKIKQYLDKGNL